jgi:hypothetical protein
MGNNSQEKLLEYAFPIFFCVPFFSIVALGSEAVAFHQEGLVSRPCGTWHTKWHWNRVFSEFFGFPLSISFHRGSPYSYITLGMNNRSVGGRSSEMLKLLSAASVKQPGYSNMFQASCRTSRFAFTSHENTETVHNVKCQWQLWKVEARSSHWLDDCVRFRAKAKDFFVARCVRPALGPTQPPIQWIIGVLSPGVKL